jgi:hypothetical protein
MGYSNTIAIRFRKTTLPTINVKLPTKFGVRLRRYGALAHLICKFSDSVEAKNWGSALVAD